MNIQLKFFKKIIGDSPNQIMKASFNHFMGLDNQTIIAPTEEINANAMKLYIVDREIKTKKILKTKKTNEEKEAYSNTLLKAKSILIKNIINIMNEKNVKKVINDTANLCIELTDKELKINMYYILKITGLQDNPFIHF